MRTAARTSALLLTTIGLLGVAFLVVSLWQTWEWTQKHIDNTADQQAELAAQFDDALRKYIAKHVRPEMEKLVAPGAFIPEAMSTSFVARRVFDAVQERFPNYLLRIPAKNPRNPANTATDAEKAIIRFFEDHPLADSWCGTIDVDGTSYHAHAIPRRTEAACLHCHGRPEDAPAAVIERYGSSAGFGRSVGDVSIDLVGIPVSEILARARADVHRHMLAAAVLCVAFIAAIALLIHLDVRRRHRAQRILQESERRFRTIIAAARDAIVVMGPQGDITLWSPGAEVMFGWTARQAMGKSLHSLLAPAHYHEAHAGGFLAFQVTGRGPAVGKTLELTALHRNGHEFPIELSLSALDLNGGWHAVGIIRDITERKRTEESLRQSKADLEKANEKLEQAIHQANQMTLTARMADKAKTEFLANMSHEIRTPMTAILGFADVLQEEVNCCGRCHEIAQCQRRRNAQDAVTTIRRNGEHLLSIINDILDLSKIEAGKMTAEQIDCSPHQLVAEIASLARPRAAAKALSFNIEFVGPIPATIRSDPLRIRQILVNLIGNAVKFTETGGVTLFVRLAPDSADTHLQFDVLDTGIGMTEEQAARIFRPFSQADASTTRQFGGSGLGLTISKRLAQLLGGDVTLVETQPGRGTRFCVSVTTGPLDGVPMIEGRANDDALAVQHRSAHELSPDTTPVRPLDGCRILLAEDGPDNQRLISFVLKRAGIDVTLAENGKIAVDKALAARDTGMPFDVILMDMQMPVLDGYQAAAILRDKGYSGPIIALTANAMGSDRRKCLDAGCTDYATKPIDRSALVETIRTHIPQPLRQP